MNRSGYTDDWSGDGSGDWDFIRWRGAVQSAIRGKRGQAFLREMIEALDAMPDKRLIKNELQDHPTLLDSGVVVDGPVCALGSVGVKRGLALDAVDPEDNSGVASLFGISDALAREIMWINDKSDQWRETPEQRWARVYRWAVSCLVQPANTLEAEQ